MPAFNRFFAALMGCLLIALPAQAGDLYLSLGIDTGWAKQEMQGVGVNAGQELHFSLITQSKDYSVELGRQGAYTLNGRALDLGVALIHAGPQSVDAAQSPQGWIAKTGRLATTESLSALIVGRQTLWSVGATRLDAGIGLGFAATNVRLQEPGHIRQDYQTVPQGMLALREAQTTGKRTEIWLEGRYLTSPAVTVNFGPDRQIGHETSGWSMGLGVTILFK